MMKAVVLSVLLSCLFFAQSEGAVGETIYTATLTPSQVVDIYVSANNIGSAGTAFCRISRYADPPNANCYIQHNVEELRNATISYGSRGTNGPDVVILDIRRGFSLRGQISFNSQAELNDFLDGNYYINIASLDYPDGEIRGQIEQRDRFYANLLPQFTIPTSSGTDASGVALATYAQLERVMDLDLVHDVGFPLSTDLNIGAVGRAGYKTGSYSGASPFFSAIAVTSGEDEALKSDLLYLNVRSQNNPQGDIRGQMISIDYIHRGAFTSALSGTNAGTNSAAIGNAVFTYNCDTHVLEYVIYHTVQSPISAVIFEGDSAASLTTVLAFLSSGQSPIYGSTVLDGTEIASLYARQLFVGIQSASSSGVGEISGSISDEYSLFAYLSGTNVVPAVTTQYGGLILFSGITGGSTSLQMIHNVPNAVEAAVMVGREGENRNNERRLLDSPYSPSDLTMNIDNGEQKTIEDGNEYVEIRTARYPNGILRGQIQTLNRCTNTVDYTLSVGESNGSLQPGETSVLNYLSSRLNVNVNFNSAPTPFVLPIVLILTTLFMLI